MLPTFGFKDQVTAVFVVFDTAAVNCCCCREFKETVAGLTVTVMTTTCNEKDALELLKVAATWTLEFVAAPVIPSVNVPELAPAGTVTDGGAETATLLFWP